MAFSRERRSERALKRAYSEGERGGGGAASAASATGDWASGSSVGGGDDDDDDDDSMPVNRSASGGSSLVSISGTAFTASSVSEGVSATEGRRRKSPEKKSSRSEGRDW